MNKECIQKAHKLEALEHRMDGLTKPENFEGPEDEGAMGETQGKLKKTVKIMMRENQDLKKDIRNHQRKR